MKEADSAGVRGDAQGWSPGTKTELKTELDVGLRWLEAEVLPIGKKCYTGSHLIPPLAEAGPTESLCQELVSLPLQKLESKCTRGQTPHTT